MSMHLQISAGGIRRVYVGVSITVSTFSNIFFLMILSTDKVMWWTRNEYEAMVQWYWWVETQNTWTEVSAGARDLTWTQSVLALEI